MHPVAFNIGGFEIASYGVMTALAYAAAIYYASSQRVKTGLDQDTFWNLIFAIVLGALIGGKLLYVILYWHEMGDGFADRFIQSLKSIRSGFVFLGGLLGAASAFLWYAKRKKFSFFKAADYLAPATALGHAIGRIGCFLAGCCHGGPTNICLGVKFSASPLVNPAYKNLYVHPVQLYESFGNLLIFTGLVFLLKKKEKTGFNDGIVTAVYFMAYAVLRFVIEFFRGDDRGGFFFGLSPSQNLSLLLFAAGIIICFKLSGGGAGNRKKNGKKRNI